MRTPEGRVRSRDTHPRLLRLSQRRKVKEHRMAVTRPQSTHQRIRRERWHQEGDSARREFRFHLLVRRMKSSSGPSTTTRSAVPARRSGRHRVR